MCSLYVTKCWALVECLNHKLHTDTILCKAIEGRDRKLHTFHVSLQFQSGRTQYRNDLIMASGLDVTFLKDGRRK
jgi:hypothetical protein